MAVAAALAARGGRPGLARPSSFFVEEQCDPSLASTSYSPTSASHQSATSISELSTRSELQQGPRSDYGSLNVVYGGHFAWVGGAYRMEVALRGGLLQWLNALTKSVLDLDQLTFMQDGGFRRPGEDVPMFPMGKYDLRWRWDPLCERIIIDFFKSGEKLDWRWDELRPTDARFPSTYPDLVGVGHVGKKSFDYQLLSMNAEGEAGITRDSGALNDPMAALAAVNMAERIVDGPLIDDP